MPDLSTWRSRLAPARTAAAVINRVGPPPPRRTVSTPRVAEAGPPVSDPAGVVPWSLRASAAWAWRFLVVAAALAVIGYLVTIFQTIIVAFAMALLLAVLLEPVARWLRRRLRLPNSLAAAVAILGTLAALVALIGLSGRAIVNGFGELADQAVAGFDQLVVWLSDGPLAIDQAQIDTWIEQVREQVRGNSDVLISGVLNATGSVTSIITGAVIALFCLFFFLKEGRHIWRWFVRLAPRRARVSINESGIRAWVAIGSYARTQILVAVVDAVGIALGALVLGVPLVLPIGVLVFLGSFIPIVGAFLTGAVAVLVALVDEGVGTALIMLLIVLLVQQIEGNLLQPWLQGHALSLHPIAILLAVTAGVGVAGVLGALLSVPIAAVLNTVLLYLHGHDKYPELADDPDRPGGPPDEIDDAIEASYPEVADEADEKNEDEDDGGSRWDDDAGAERRYGGIGSGAVSPTTAAREVAAEGPAGSASPVQAARSDGEDGRA